MTTFLKKYREMKIFIVHYKKLTDRKKYLELALDEYNYEFVENFDRESIDEFDTMYNKNSKLWNDRVYGNYENCNYRDLRDSEVCNSLSHIEAMRKIVNDKLDYGIILEDDVIIGDDFKTKIDYIISNVPDDFDFVFFGNSYSMEALDNATSDKSINVIGNIWKKKYGITRTVDAYIVSNKAATLLVDNIKEIVLPFDFELTYFFRDLEMDIYWYDPGFVRQGSMSGIYRSSIR